MIGEGVHRGVAQKRKTREGNKKGSIMEKFMKGE
jgi:hypothetical protein